MHLLPLVMLAAAFWGQTPDCGEPSIFPAQLPVISDKYEVIGRADLDDCAILVDPRRFRFAGAACMTVLHEVGHLQGYYDPIGFRWPDGRIDHSHSPDPEDVMYPIIRKAVWPCAW